MKSSRTLRMAWLAAPLVAGVVAAGVVVATPVYAQTDQTASLLEALSLVSGGLLGAPGQASQVTRQGDHFHVHIPLPKLTAPPGASMDVAATPLSSGAWNITGLTFPQTGTLVSRGWPEAPTVSVRFSIGQQVAHARVDPTLSVPSPYAMAISDLAFHIDSAAPPADLTIGQATFDGTMMGDTNGRMSTRSRGEADDLHFATRSKAGGPFALSLKRIDLRYNLDGLDRARAERLREAVGAVATVQRDKAAVPGEPSSIEPAEREHLRAAIDASAGLLSGLDVAENFHGLHFDTAEGSQGDIGEVRLALAAKAGDGRVAGHYDVGLNDINLAAAVPARFARYTPRRVEIRTAFSGLPAEALRHLLRDAVGAGADQAVLRAQAMALLNAPEAHVGVETMLIEAGPMLLRGSVQVRPMPDGSAAFDMSLKASGLEAMLALVQSDPQTQRIMPMLYLAKGLGRPDGDGIVWDIRFAGGVVTVNGISLGGYRAGGVPGARPPPNR